MLQFLPLLAAAFVVAAPGCLATTKTGIFRLEPLRCFDAASASTLSLPEQRSRLGCAAACLRRGDCSAFEFRTSAAACAIAIGNPGSGLWTNDSVQCAGAVAMVITGQQLATTATPPPSSGTPFDILPASLRGKVEVLIDFRRSGSATMFASTGYSLAFVSAMNVTDGVELSGNPNSYLMLTHPDLNSRFFGSYSVMMYANLVGIGTKRSNLMSISRSLTNPLDGDSLFLFNKMSSFDLVAKCSAANDSMPLALALSFFGTSSGFASVGINFFNTSVVSVLNTTAAVGFETGGSGDCLGQSGLRTIRLGWGDANNGLSGTVGCIGAFSDLLTAADMGYLTAWCTMPIMS